MAMNLPRYLPLFHSPSPKLRNVSCRMSLGVALFPRWHLLFSLALGVSSDFSYMGTSGLFKNSGNHASSASAGDSVVWTTAHNCISCRRLRMVFRRPSHFA
eukprot:12613378-Prorocentrum_lima.AAC.1